ncbi:serine/threonine protein kinase [Planctomycetes bacterium K23_9]|uniref:Serine/threonine-protein kinase PrkC n=1 Tax=Stieleria marina TaxID=1930275 RepID=A0A517NTC4_9BACT|nr:Serine/threonine-protein kinase PrkC [Planctomycetes bacterium K23_9]
MNPPMLIAARRNCLAPSELADVLSGNFPAEGFDSAIAHMDDCDHCRSAIESIDKHEPWIAKSITDPSADPLQAETACQIALWKMLQSSESSQLAPEVLPCTKLGPYSLLKTLGSGGMGTVYLAQHDRLKRNCAVKLLPRERVDQAGWLERFEREMTSVANLEHPNVVRATDAGHQDGWHYLVMEYLDGLDVGRIANRMNQIQIADACEIVRQTALGLSHIHESGLIHRDIKPSNLMLCRDGQVKILDLGLVLAGDDPLSQDDRLTTVGHLMGTMPYMAPEQLVDSREVDARADVYSLGATLYRLIAGRPPHKRRRSLASHVLAITNQDAPAINTLRIDVAPGLASVIGEMLTRDPAHRPDSASQLATKLEPFSEGSRLKGMLREALRRPKSEDHSVSIMPSASLNRLPPTPPRQRWGIAAAAAAFLIVAGLLFRIQTDKGTLVIHSEQSDLTVLVRQDDQVIERLIINQAGENRTILRKGSYRIEIEGGGAPLKLSEDVVTIGRGEVASVNVTSNHEFPIHDDGDRLYQGKPLEHWMSQLRREQDVHAIGLAMDAVEKLTRPVNGKANSEARRAAAELAADRARKLGGIVSSGLGLNANAFDNESPSHRFTAYFNEVFPKFFAEPGLAILNHELAEGTSASKSSLVWALNNYITGARNSYASSQDRSRARPELRIISQTAEGKTLCQSVLQRLRTIGDSLPANFAGRGSVIQLADRSVYVMGVAVNDSVVGVPWLESMTRNRMDRYVQQWEKSKLKPEGEIGFEMGIGNAWPDSDLLKSAIQMAGSKPDSKWWDYLAATCLNQQLDYNAERFRPEEVLDLIKNNAPIVFLDSIDSTLQNYIARSADIKESVGDSYSGAGSMGGSMGGYGGMTSTPVSSLAGNSPTWNFALQFYALEKSKDAEEAASALMTLRNLRSEMKRHQVEKVQWNEKRPYAQIDRAIETVRESVEPDSAKTDADE